MPYDDCLVIQLVGALEVAGHTSKHVAMLGRADALLADLILVLDGEAEIKKEKRVATEIVAEQKVTPVPGFGQVREWLHEGQKTGVVGGKIIFDYLRDNDMLKSCLGPQGLEEIQKEGIVRFWQNFQDKAVFGWALVTGDDDSVPCLVGHKTERDGEIVGKVILCRRPLNAGWSARDPALLRTG